VHPAVAEQASANVSTVAAASEEISSAISEIARQVETSSQGTSKAVSEVEHANATIGGLAESAHKIGEIVSLINDIAAQTNLLALDATIEASRAGEAGKGFAVVASEVKQLASQTAKATEEISSQISTIQAETDGSVELMKEIVKVIADFNEVTVTIASAIEEQRSSTKEIWRHV
jgi:methyl-accepting chemotaxis protein